ncbi:alpha/beta fold hydrolase [Caballeronia sp. LZ043]|uniref:alpha/beta hydrolase family protein n=1 Tax=Caballeronia sp. LZ043 TaxID=3038569 RepID=UPI00285D6B13|nr:alpha/beta fold hydrolase [Caballeronia sp. LZ043]MDR5823622.1 alpha/beta fold hydrolase [Caballeronia sp. LZ043]
MKPKFNLLKLSLGATLVAPMFVGAAEPASVVTTSTNAQKVKWSNVALSVVPSVARPSDSGALLTDEAIQNLAPELATHAARADRISYRSYSLDGRRISVSGVLLVPRGAAPQGGWPVVSWAHGSSGTSDACAPSLASNKDGRIDLYGYGPFVSELLKAGYAVVATDYEGLGMSGEHPYIVADSEGRGVIDAVRAGMEADRSLSDSWFAVGHSQGGQAVIAAGELAPSWGSGLDFRGTVGLAPVTNVGQAYYYGSPGPVDRGFYLLALQGIATIHPELKYADYLGKQALAMFDETRNECTFKIWESFSANLGSKLNDYQFTPQSPEAALALQHWLDEQSVPRGRTPGPMLLLQGDKDPSIKMAVTLQAVRNARAAGTPAEFRLYPGKDHYSVLDGAGKGGAATDVVKWLDSKKRS